MTLALLLASGVALVGVAMVAPVGPAQATFTGANGKIVFVSNRNTPQNTNPEGDFEIFTMNPDGSELRQLTNNAATDSEPAWSPDGQSISFQSTRNGGNTEIYLMNSDGSNVTRLTNHPAEDTYAVFSPSSDRIVFVSNRDGDYEIYTMNADGSGSPTNLTQNTAFDADSAVSPDGKIAFASHRDGDFEIYSMNLDGSNQTNLTNDRAFDAYPNYSSDGQKILFHRNRTGDFWGDFEIYSMNADGTGQVNLSNNPAARDVHPAPSPDGTKIAFESIRDGNQDIYVMDADGSNVTRLTLNAAGDASPDWQPISVSAGPTSKAECKNGGYKEFGFKNQGRCIAFVIRTSHKQSSRTYSVVGGFSATQNPSGAWSYGYQVSGGSDFTLYPYHRVSAVCNCLDGWWRTPDPAIDTGPNVVYNHTGQVVNYLNIVHPPDMLNIHPGPVGQKSVVRWTAPFSGTVKIEGRFVGIDKVGTTTDVAVVHNSATTLLNGNINSYGDTVPFSIARSVEAGDTIGFSVGFGRNNNYYYDSTGLSATISY